MASSVSGYSSFIDQRTLLMDQATDPALKAHFKAEIDLVKSWSGADPGDIRDDPPPAPPPGGSPGGSSPSQLGGTVRVNTRAPEPGAPTPPPGGGTSGGSGSTSGIISAYSSKLPPNMPAVFDLKVGNTGKTLRELTEDAAAQTGTPAIVLAGQMWQETKAGLYGKDAAFVAKYGAPGSGAGSGDVLDSVVQTSTTNPGNGMSDSGILQVNPETLAALVSGGNMGGGVTLPPHPELAGRNPNNIEDALLISGTLMKDYHDYYAKQSYTKSDDEAWDYALRAYVGGPGSVIPGNPYGRAAGGGDVTYVDKVHDHMTDFANGVAPRWKA